MEGEDILQNELNPEVPLSDNVAEPQTSAGSGGMGSRFVKFVGRNKGKIAGFGGGGLIASILMMFGSMLSGPMQIIHAGQVIGEVIDTARTLTSGARVARNLYKLGANKSYVAIKQSSRLSAFMRVPTQNFVNRLANEAGVRVLTNGTFDTVGRGVEIVGNNYLSQLVLDGVAGNDIGRKQVKKILSMAIDDMPGNSIYKFIMKRNVNKMYGLRWYDGITRFVSGKLGDLLQAGSKLATRLSTWIANQQIKNGEKLARKGIAFGDDLAEIGFKSLANIADGIPTGFIARMSSSIGTKALKVVPVLGTIIGFGLDFLIGYLADKAKVEELLISSMIKAGEISTAADDIRNGTVPQEDDEGNYIPAETYLEVIATQNIYRTYDSVDENGVSTLSNNSAYAANGDCANISLDNYETAEEYNVAVSVCMESAQNEMIGLAKDTTIGSSFFSNTPLQAEFDPYFAVEEETAEYYRGVPTQLSSNIGKDTILANLANALIASITIVGPKDVADFMEKTFNTEELSPSDIGGTSMYGARVQQNDLSVSEGARSLSKEEEASLLRETQTYLAEQQMQKSWFARMFDVEDYHSGIATLSRDAEWDLSDSSFTTQFANVIKTFAALPKLISKSLGTYTRAASAANPTPYNYGFNLVAYTPDQVDAEPDYWDAEAYLLDEENDGANFERIDEDKLKKCTGAVFDKDEYGIKVTWSEESTIKKMELSNGDCNDGYFDAYPESDERKYFDSHDAYDNEIQADGEAAVRTILANYKTMAAFAAISFDELEENDSFDNPPEGVDNNQLNQLGMSISETEQVLIDAMKDIGIEYSTTDGGGTGSDGGDGGGGSGNGDIVAAASDASSLYCSDCIAFVKSVYAKAGMPQPLYGALGSYVGCPQGSAGNFNGVGYQYCKGFTAVSGIQGLLPGDVIIWGNNRHAAIYLGDGLVSEGGAGFSTCQISVSPWLSLSSASGYLRYTGGD